MYKIETTKKFNKSLELSFERGYKISDIEEVIRLLQISDIPLPEKYRDHKLKGKYSDLRECHIKPDWLLIYKKTKSTLVLLLVNTGTHSDFFK